MIVVSAATGEFGRLVVDRLLDRVPAADIAVAVRNPDRAADLAGRGVEVRRGDYDDPASMRQAFDGAEVLLFISSPTLDDRVAQHGRVVTAARDAGVGRIAYTSGLGADVVDQGLLGDHHATEQAILDSGVPYTFLRHPIYTEIFVNPSLREAVESGELRSSTRGRGTNTATRADLAEAAAVVLSSPGHAGAAYNFTGPLWTFEQLAAVLSDISGRTVVCREVDHDEGPMEWFGPVIRAGGFEVQTGDVEDLLGRRPSSQEDAVRAALGRASDG
jgi:NAD(P)H dehydrogenase (quinone)